MEFAQKRPALFHEKKVFFTGPERQHNGLWYTILLKDSVTKGRRELPRETKEFSGNERDENLKSACP